MILSRRITWIFFLACIATASVALASQEPGEHASAADQSTAAAQKSHSARPALNEQQKRGEAIFVQNCTLCHIPTSQKKRLRLPVTALEGAYGEDADADALRQFIQQGIPGKMPGFRYGLELQQIDDVVAYLKTGAHLKSGGSN
jgi:mono/diheme cytochrome c family protein